MILTLTPPSAAEFKALYDQTGWAEFPEATFADALAGSWVVCTARDENGTLLGMGRLISDGVLHAFVTEMLVADRSRGQGTGARILEEFVRASKARGVEDIQLFAAQDRAAFYERNGFRRRPDRAPGMDIAAEAEHAR